MIEEPQERSVPMHWSVLGIFLTSLVGWVVIGTLIVRIVEATQ
jgi:hypothetical protein